MPNQLERELSAIHSSIAQIKRKMKETNNVDKYEYYMSKLKDYEKARMELLEQMEVEI